MIEEEENNEIRKLLRSLPAVKSGNDFLEKLDRRIRTLEPERKSAKHFLKEKQGIFEKAFGGIKSAWLAPALGLAAAVIFVFYITFMNKNEITNEQKTSNDKMEVKQEPNNTKENTSKTEILPSTKPEDPERKTESSKKTEKDITGNFDNKERENLSLQTKPSKELSDQVEAATETPKFNVELPEGIIKSDDDKLRKEKNDEIVNEGGKALEKSQMSEEKKMEDEEKSMKTPGEKMEEFEKTIQKGIMDKLNAVNKTNLENLREKVNK